MNRGSPFTSLRFPDFVIIGAMKAGTTTLYRDLATNPNVFFPRDKEPDNLSDRNVISRRGRRHYANLYGKAAPGQRCGDGSTSYSKLPDVPGVPERAAALLGEGLRVVYLVREPVARAISHHHHLLARRQAPPEFERAVAQVPGLVDYGRYSMQLKPWLDALGPESVRVIRFEEYVVDRLRMIAELSSFLSIPPRPELIDDNVAHNRSDLVAVVTGTGRALHRSQLYRRYIRPVLPAATQRRMRRLVSRPAPARPARPSFETVVRLVETFRQDEEELRVLLNQTSPLWDWDTVIETQSRIRHS